MPKISTKFLCVCIIYVYFASALFILNASFAGCFVKSIKKAPSLNANTEKQISFYLFFCYCYPVIICKFFLLKHGNVFFLLFFNYNTPLTKSKREILLLLIFSINTHSFPSFIFFLVKFCNNTFNLRLR